MAKDKEQPKEPVKLKRKNIGKEIVEEIIKDEKKFLAFITPWWNKFVVLMKSELHTFVVGIVFGLMIAFLTMMFWNSNNASEIDSQARNAIVGFFYPWTDKAVSRDVIEAQIDTILKSEYPELELAVWFNESKGNPAAVSTSKARGPFQIVNSWVPKLIEAGVIKDERDLHDPIKGCLAGDKVFGYHLTDAKVKGDLMAGLRDYVGSKDKPGNVEYVQKVLATYGNIKLLQVAVKKKRLGVNVDSWWMLGEGKSVKPDKKFTPAPVAKKTVKKTEDK